MEKDKGRGFMQPQVIAEIICAIFMHFQAILSKSALTAGIFLRALSNSFLKYKIPLGCPKILRIVNLIIF